MKVTQKHRILYAITKASWGGAQRYVHDLALGAKTAGHDVLVVTGAPGELTERLQAEGVATASIESMRRDIGILAEIRSFFKLLQIVRDFKPDIVHGNSSKAGGLTTAAGRIMGVPRIIFTSHGWAFNEKRPRWQKTIIWAFHYSTILLSHTTICVSNALCKDTSRMPFVREKIVVIHNGVEEGVLLPKEDARLMLAPHISFPLWIGTIAELHPIKNLETLIRAFARIKDEHPDTTLMIMGEGQERVHLEALIRDFDLAERVRLRGHVQSASAYLQALDVFVLPSHSEALAYVILEAGLAKLPVIASNVGGIPEMITDGETGTLITPTDIDGLAHALSEHLLDASLRQKRGASLYKRVRADFSKETMVQKTLGVY